MCVRPCACVRTHSCLCVCWTFFLSDNILQHDLQIVYMTVTFRCDKLYLLYIVQENVSSPPGLIQKILEQKSTVIIEFRQRQILFIVRHVSSNMLSHRQRYRCFVVLVLFKLFYCINILMANAGFILHYHLKAFDSEISACYFPAGIWCQNDVVLPLMRRHHVASTLIRRHFTSCARWVNFIYFQTLLSYHLKLVK